MEPVTIYYCVKTAATIGKIALDYQKAKNDDNYKEEIKKIQIENETIKDYLSLIRTDIQSLMHIYFRSAYDNLNYALSATSESKKDYLIQARNRFIDASAIEKNENLILTYIGLSLTQGLLYDFENSKATLCRIKLVCWEDIYSDKPDIVLKDWDEVLFMRIMLDIVIAGKMFETRSIHETIEYALNRYFEHDSQERKRWHRRFEAMERCGGFSINEQTWVNAEKLILKEDFMSLKANAIEAFQIQ